MERIGVIGLGRMGSAIAQRMTGQGADVLGWTRSGRTVDGVKPAENLNHLVRHSDALVLSLLDDAAVSSVLTLLLQCDVRGKQIIDTSTVTPTTLINRADQITAKGATAVDAPISGGPELVLAGRCGVFIGGDDVAAAKATQTLGTISERIFHVGPLGTGLVMKVINNGMIMTYFNGLMDLMPLARQAGLPLETALRILSGGPAGMPVVADRIPKVLDQDKSVGFALSAAFKDNDIFNDVVESFRLVSPMLRAFGARKATVQEAGLWERDIAELIKLAYHNSDIS